MSELPTTIIAPLEFPKRKRRAVTNHDRFGGFGRAA
jgi:hypothetical protein